MKTFQSELEIFFEDLTPSGIVHPEKVVEWMSIVREHYFKGTCPEFRKFIDTPIKMFTTNISISVKEPSSQWTDKVTATLTTSSIKEISFKMHIDFLNQRTQKVIVSTVQKVAFVNTVTKKFSSVPSDMKSVIVNYVRND